MNLKTSTIDGKVVDIISEEEYLAKYDVYNNSSINSSTAVEVIDNDGNTFALPFRGRTDERPGIYPDGSVYFIKYPNNRLESSYNIANIEIIDFSDIKNINDFLEKNSQIREMETNVLTDIDSVFVPPISSSDTPEMKAFKEAVIAKHMDINKYAPRFGDNFLNDKRILKTNSITMNKLRDIGEKLDIEIELILRDKNPDVPNPMGKEVSTILTDSGGTDE